MSRGGITIALVSLLVLAGSCAHRTLSVVSGDVTSLRNSWTSLGPTTIVDGEIGLTLRAQEIIGRVLAVKAHPIHPRLWLIGTAGGGIWRTTDGGRTWRAARIHQSAGDKIRPARDCLSPDEPLPNEASPDDRFDHLSLAVATIAFGTNGRVYAGTGDPTISGVGLPGTGLLVSNDCGRSWASLPMKLKGEEKPFDWFGTIVTAIRAEGDDHVWVATSATPSPHPPLVTAQERATIHFLGLFRGRVDARGTLESGRDYFVGPVTALTSDPSDPDCMFVAVSHLKQPTEDPYFDVPTTPGVYRAASCGVRGARGWSLLREDAKTPINVKIAVGRNRANGTTLYTSAVYGPKVTLDRLDGARDCEVRDCRWHPITFEDVSGDAEKGAYCNWDPSSPTPFGPRGCTYANTLTVGKSNEEDADTLYAGGVALWKCRECGIPGKRPQWADVSRLTPLPSERLTNWSIGSWYLRAPRYVSPHYGIHVDQQGMDWTTDGRLLVGNDGGVWSTADGGVTWANHNFGLVITQVYRGALDPRRPDVVFAGTQDTGTIRRDGWRWRFVQGGDGAGVVVSHRYPAIHWATVHRSVLVRSSVDQPNLLAVWRTRDGGLTFQRADLGMELDTRQIVPPFVQCPDSQTDVLLFGTKSLWRMEDFFEIPTIRAFEMASPPAWRRNAPGGSKDITAIAFARDAKGMKREHKCRAYAYVDMGGQVLMTTRGGGTAGLGSHDWIPVGRSFVADDDSRRTVSALAFAEGHAFLYATISRCARRYTCEPGQVYRFDAPALAGAGDAWANVTPRRQDGTVIDVPFHALAVVHCDDKPCDGEKKIRHVIFAGGDSDVWMSVDQGQRWCHLALDENTPHIPVRDLRVHPHTRAVYVFTLGRGVFRLDDVAGAVEACAPAAGPRGAFSSTHVR